MLQVSTIQFLNDLAKNNHKEWFDSNRKKYEAAKADFASLVQHIIQDFGIDDTSIAHLQAKDCVFRINRDVRFSKDKSPYKTNMGASFSKGGKKSTLAGYYFHCEPGGNSFVGGGLYMPEPDGLKKLRQEIDYNWETFNKIIQQKKFIGYYNGLDTSSEYKLSREPKGYEKDNPAIEYLKLKCFVATHNLSDESLTAKTLTKEIINAFSTLKPLIQFINQALEE